MDISIDEINNIVKNITMNRVYSNNILAMGYDSNKNIMRIVFQNKSSYLYFNVEPDMWKTIIESESKGKALNENIVKHKEKYKYIKL